MVMQMEMVTIIVLRSLVSAGVVNFMGYERDTGCFSRRCFETPVIFKNNMVAHNSNYDY